MGFLMSFIKIKDYPQGPSSLSDNALEEHGDAYALMATLKRAIDPENIMNPGKIVEIN